MFLGDATFAVIFQNILRVSLSGTALLLCSFSVRNPSIKVILPIREIHVYLRTVSRQYGRREGLSGDGLEKSVHGGVGRMCLGGWKFELSRNIVFSSMIVSVVICYNQS